MDTAGLPTNRADAKATGAKYYFTGEPCKHGHIAPRKAKGVCVECMRIEWETSNTRRSEQPKSKASKEASRRYYEKNRDAVLARAQARPTADKQAYRQRHKHANPDMYKTLTSLRRRRFRDATPTWLTHNQKTAIRELYKIAIAMSRTTGERYVVDHIVPLNGETVCGLHVPWNLRVITQDENLAKSNKLL